VNELERLAELGAYQILDTDPEAAFDGLVRAAAMIAGVPMSTVTLMDADRQWFKAQIGMASNEGERHTSFCDHVVRSGDEMIVPDTSLDDRFAGNPLVLGQPNIAFYAGFPLESPSGAVLGTLCVIDDVPRVLTDEQLVLLRTLAEQVMAQLQLRRELLEKHTQETRFRSLVENSLDIIASHRKDGSISYISPALRTILGIDPSEVTDSSVLRNRINPEDRPAFRAAMDAAMNGTPGTVLGRAQHINGNWHQLETTLIPIPDDSGVIQEVLATSRDITERVTAEWALSAANAEVLKRGQQLEEAQRLAGVGSFTYEVTSQAITWSRELKRIFHQPDTFEPTFGSYSEMIHPDDRDVLTGSVATAMSNGTFYEVEHRIITLDGEERILLARGQVETDDDGQPIRVNGTGQDVTEARRTADELLRTGTLFAQILASTEQAIIATDVDGLITVFNQGAERMLGYTAAEMVGVSTPAVFHDTEEVRERALELGIEPGFGVFVHNVLAGEPETRQWTYVSRDHTRHPVELTVTALREADGELIGFIGVASDVAEQRRIERERDAHAMMLRAVIENNQSVIYVRDLDGRFLMVNRAFEEAFGVREADLLGVNAFADNARADQWQANHRQAMERPYRVVEIADLADGPHYYDAIKVPLKDAAGQTYAICGLSLDITERRRAEANTAKAVEAMALARDAAIAATKAKSAFLATMSHEIRTPMNAVIGMTGLLLDTALDLEQRDLLETVRASGDQLLSIINDILDFSKIEAGDLELEEHPLELREAVEGTIALFAGTAHGLDLVSHVSDDCPPVVVGDVTRLRQVLANLVGNAVKFTKAGHVFLRVEPEEDQPADGDQIRLRFTVADSGIGISPEGMSRLFKSFSQVDASTTRVYGGTGLGLAISKAIVEAMDGALTVTSTAGVGSEFTFSVRLGRFAGPQTHLRGPAESLIGKQVLIVDDNDTNRRILRLQLEGYDMVCTDCSDPLAALALIGGGAQFDVAVLDFAMPLMDGAQLALALRQLPTGRTLPLVLLSSLGRRERDDERLFSIVLTKPTRSSTLIEALGEVLAQPAIVPGPAPVPVAAAAPAAAIPPQPGPGSPPRAAPAPDPGGLRILLAEDNEINQKVGRLMLAKLGHQVDIVDNGQGALEAVQKMVYDVVLMDMHMPVMDGLEATRRIRAELPPERQPYIIALTASVTKEDRDACAEAGMNGYLPKPVRAAELTTALKGLGVPTA
jgi:PAS domain S-box-containing protein